MFYEWQRLLRALQTAEAEMERCGGMAAWTARFQLPRVVMLGDVGVGKSSVLEAVLEVDSLLPKGLNCVTRRPVVIEPSLSTTHPSTVRITREDVSLCTADPVRMTCKALSFVAVDLPGMTKVPRPGQPVNVEQLTAVMARAATDGKEALLLVVLAADCDPVNSAALKLVHEELDPTGSRTVVVVTKIDLLEGGAGRFAYETFKEAASPCRAMLAVRNGSQLELTEGKSASRREEALLFRTAEFPWGIRALQTQIEGFLVECGRGHMWRLCAAAERQCDRLCRRLERQVDPQRQLRLVSEYIDTVRSRIQGTCLHSPPSIAVAEETNEAVVLTGGARIGFILGRVLPDTLESIDPLRDIDMDRLQLAIRNAKGLQSTTFVPDRPFQTLVRTQLVHYERVVRECFAAVLTELQAILYIPGFATTHDGEREEEVYFDAVSASASPSDIDSDVDDETRSIHAEIATCVELAETVNAHVTQILQRNGEQTRRFLEDLLAIESSRVATNDSTFWRLHQQHYETLICRSAGLNSHPNEQTTTTHDTSEQTLASAASEPTSPSAASRDADESELELPSTLITASSTPTTDSPKRTRGILSEFLSLFFHSSPTHKIEYRPRQLHASLKTVRLNPGLVAHEREMTAETVASVVLDKPPVALDHLRSTVRLPPEEVSFILALLRAYLAVVRRNLADTVPKAIAHFLLQQSLRDLPLCLLPSVASSRQRPPHDSPPPTSLTIERLRELQDRLHGHLQTLIN